MVGLDRSVISKNVQNTKISDMHTLLAQGHDMEYIARHYNMDLALVWALRSEGKRIRKNSKNLAGDFAHGINGILTNVMNDSETTGPGGYLRNSSPTRYTTSQNPATSSSTLCPLSSDLRLLTSVFCPLSSERLSGNQVQKMQDKCILGTVGKTLLIAKRS